MFKKFKNLPELSYCFDESGTNLSDTQIQKQQVLDLAKDLINCRSITPYPAGANDILINRLQQSGFEIEVFEKNGVQNFYAKRNSTSKSNGKKSSTLVFAGHVDVVPPGKLENWNTDPFVAEEIDGYLYGRGAADMKGSLASMVVAVERYIKAVPEHAQNIAFIITSDEEGDAIDGTRLVVDALKKRNETIDYAIVGEPTSSLRLADSIRIGRRGSINCRIKIRGKQGHVGYPEQLKNPIHISSKLIYRLTQKRWDVPSRFFPSTSCQLVTLVSDSGAMNVTPSDLELAFNFRYSPRNSFDKIRKYVDKKIKKYQLDAEVDWYHEAKPYLTKRGKLRKTVQQVIMDETGLKTKLTTAGGISDGRFLKDIAKQVIELGPSNKTIHQANECVSVDELNELCSLYQSILKRL